MVILHITIDVCQKFGEIRNDLRKNGKLIGDFDILIAATAIVNNLELITNNKADFLRIKEARLWG